MQIGPSLSVLQALGSQPGAPEPARLKPAAQVAAQAEVQRAVEHNQPALAGAVPLANAATVAGIEPEAAATSERRRLDILV
ncbi:MAG: hypothetical protein R3349_12850 [Geminicoccaceae bacterium]|nr:hypothetical protein [Geminicoccaceae bacterium]